MTEAKQGTRQGHKAAGTHAGGEGRDQTNHDAPPDGAADMRGRVDQFGALLSKSLDLAEAGLGLGITLVNRVGSAAQQQILDRFMSQVPGMNPGMTPASQNTTPPPPTGPEMAPSEAAQAAPSAEPESYGIGNRLPLAPGDMARISFSINNDSAEAPKKVMLALEGFIGEQQGQRLDAAGFALKPAKKTIAPMDFEKFVLEGTLPATTAPDIYRGWVVVHSDDELRIPVWLVVSPH